MSAVTFRTAGEVNEAMGRVYGNMGLAVLTSMIVSFLVSTSPALMAFFFTGIMKWVTIFSPLVVILLMSFAQQNFSTSQLKLFLHGFAALMD